MTGDQRQPMRFRVGDEAWIYLAHHRGEMTKGIVIAELDLPGYGYKNYVIEIDTHIDPILEIRSSGLGMFKANHFKKKRPAKQRMER